MEKGDRGRDATRLLIHFAIGHCTKDYLRDDLGRRVTIPRCLRQQGKEEEQDSHAKQWNYLRKLAAPRGTRYVCIVTVWWPCTELLAGWLAGFIQGSSRA